MEPPKSNQLIFSQWIVAIRKRDWEYAETFLATDVIVNENTMARRAYIQRLRNARFETASLDVCIADDEAAVIAARFVLSRPPEPTLGQGEEWTEQTLFSLVNGKISSIQVLAGPNQSAVPGCADQSGEKTESAKALRTSELRKFYTRYIDSINTLTMRGHFDDFCQDTVTHNYINYSRDEYREMIESSFEDISGLHFTIESLIVNEEAQQVAARLGFTGVPTKEFRGIAPTGKPVRFGEHAFYQLEKGRIKQVWSLLDLEAYKSSIA
ncbi:hypothetical protein V2A60_002699 [Cordyceps javanica]